MPPTLSRACQFLRLAPAARHSRAQVCGTRRGRIQTRTGDISSSGSSSRCDLLQRRESGAKLVAGVRQIRDDRVECAHLRGQVLSASGCDHDGYRRDVRMCVSGDQEFPAWRNTRGCAGAYACRLRCLDVRRCASLGRSVAHCFASAVTSCRRREILTQGEPPAAGARRSAARL